MANFTSALSQARILHHSARTVLPRHLMQNRGGNLLPADCGLALRWVSTMLSHDFSPPFGEHVFIFFPITLSKSMDPGPLFFQKVMGLRRDSFTIDVHTDPSEIHESYHHQSQDTVFKAMQRRRFTYCTKSLQSKKCIAHGPTAESLIFGGPVSKKH